MAATISISRLYDTVGVWSKNPDQTLEDFVLYHSDLLAELRPYGVEVQNRYGENFLIARVELPSGVEEIEVYLGSDDPMANIPDRYMHW